MADERCAFPGDSESADGFAADPAPARWLDRETAELLLRGESLETVDAAARDQAERLAKTLEGLIVEPPLSSAELPGEAAALAAFRAARSGALPEQAAAGPHRARPRTPDAGLVRIGGLAPDPRRSRWGRPARFGLTAVLAAGMVGGVAFAATTGVLPTPFGHDEPHPVASVSVGASPDRPLVSPSQNSALGDPTPDGSSSPSAGPTTPHGRADGGSSAKPGSGSDDGRATGGGWWLGAPSACRDVRDGRELTADRRRALEGAAGGSGAARVWKYCKNVLAGTDGASRGGDDKDGKGKGGQGDQGHQNGKGGDQGDQGGDGDGHHIAPGSPTVTPSPLPPLLPRQLVTTPTPSPKPPYSAL
ncbi:hypothetical protein [Streptomyces sp. TLI_185]|uniref:hypothetical protein n=1 Tax=Streptomyces sp. TLI_185 TaxID=2485151 RepID=UPI000FA500C7|nr:hypothetical protein [Streptomyces sp. TLI_185]RPF35805.1 hypothetical protein EDD92_5830 [Streptomyces sp. TLI_185]